MWIFTLILSSFGQDELKHSYMSGLERHEEFQRVQNEGACADIPIGSKNRYMIKSPLDSSSPNGQPFNPMVYTMERTRDKNYKLIVPLTFIAGETYDGGDIPAGLTGKARERFIDAKYRPIALKCLKEFSAKMPLLDGKKIELTLDPTYDVAYQRFDGNTIDVMIENKNYPSDGTHYASSGGCELYAHEFLHFSGLADTYISNKNTRGILHDRYGKPLPELGEQSARQYDCRPIPPVQTLMGDGTLWAKDAKIFKVAFTCICKTERCTPPAKTVPKGIIISETESSCPAEYRKNVETRSVVFPQTDIDNSFLDPAYQYVVMKKADPPPLLAPAQLRHLIYPRCQAKNRRFYNCSAGSYDSTTTTGCGLLSEQCSRDPTWMD